MKEMWNISFPNLSTNIWRQVASKKKVGVKAKKKSWFVVVGEAKQQPQKPNHQL